MIKKPSVYKKHHSFENFYSAKPDGIELLQSSRAIRLLQAFLSEGNQSYFGKILRHCLQDLEAGNKAMPAEFKIVRFVAEEMDTLADKQILPYLFHRYRYDVFPQEHQLDDYPPYVQIEPASMCNYRCTFCYQTDRYFQQSRNMGFMSFDTYKAVVDQLHGKVEFLSLASRGEPLLCKEIDRMLDYSVGKFLALKINTNASVLNEAHAHAILAGGVKTVVFSADSPDSDSYSRLRINGDFEKVLKNIEMFQEIKTKHYSDSRIISRISGVWVSDSQDMDLMKATWGRLVDQITFVNYNPWENIYDARPSSIQRPCSDLWRRMFIWFNGVVNPCDTDFKSLLSVGNILDQGVPGLWRSGPYQDLRKEHLDNHRQMVEPCRRCAVI